MTTKSVRTAMTLLLNRESILKNIYYCMGKEVSGPFYINTPYYDQSITPLPYDPAKAKQLLAEAGWIDHNHDGIRDKDGKDFKFEFLIPSGSENAGKNRHHLQGRPGQGRHHHGDPAAGMGGVPPEHPGLVV